MGGKCNCAPPDLTNVWCVATVTLVLIIKKDAVSKSQNVKDGSHANKYLRKNKVNL